MLPEGKKREEEVDTQTGKLDKEEQEGRGGIAQPI